MNSKSDADLRGEVGVDIPVIETTWSDDDAHILDSMGYKQDLHRGLDGFMTFAMGSLNFFG